MKRAEEPESVQPRKVTSYDEENGSMQGFAEGGLGNHEKDEIHERGGEQWDVAARNSDRPQRADWTDEVGVKTTVSLSPLILSCISCVSWFTLMITP